LQLIFRKAQFTPPLGHLDPFSVPGRGQPRTLVGEKEAMAPCTYIGLALGAAPGGRIRFESLEFADIVFSLAKLCTSGT
jgi:hypothetical protein